MRRDHRVPPSMCPRCGRLATGALEATRDRPGAPKFGDLSVCINCAGVNQYDAELRLVPLSSTELEGLAEEEQADIRRAQRTIAAMIAQLGPPRAIGSGRA